MDERRNSPSADSLDFVIPLNPVTKKNSQQIIRNPKNGRPMIIPSGEYRSYEQKCKECIPPYHIDYRCNVEAHYYRDSHRRVDLCNLHEALCDVLVKWGCIDDDNVLIVATMDGSFVDYDKKNPRTEVRITRLGENNG